MKSYLVTSKGEVACVSDRTHWLTDVEQTLRSPQGCVENQRITHALRLAFVGLVKCIRSK